MTYQATCDQCGTVYRAGERGGHCRGGKFGGCCATFGSDTAADQHRAGPYSARRCLTAPEMREKGWWQDAEGVWRLPAPAGNPWTGDAA